MALASSAVQQSGGSQRERADAHRCDSDAVIGGGLKRDQYAPAWLTTMNRCDPGTTTRSASANASKPEEVRISTWPHSAVVLIVGRSPHTRISYRGTPWASAPIAPASAAARLAMPNTWPGIINSKPMTWSSASTATIIVARS